MTFMRLPLKNAFVKWWRSLTLGLFVFFMGLCMILFHSFGAAIARNVENAVVYAVAGHVQIRSDRSREIDMVAQYKAAWDALEPIPASIVLAAKRAAGDSLPRFTSYDLVRQNVSLGYGARKEDVMLMGIEDDFNEYRKAFQLTKGRYIDAGSARQILLPEELATRFRIDVGDNITVMTKNRYGFNARMELTVCGTGNFLVLSLFSWSGAYTDIGTMRELIKLAPDEATDIVLYADGFADSGVEARKLANAVSLLGIKASLAGDTPMGSSELKVQSLSEIREQFKKPSGVSISTHVDMGKTYQSMGGIVSAALDLFLSFLFLIAFIMIMNLVFMMGFERFREIGTLRAIGIRRGRILALFLGEIALVAGAFAVLGILLGAGAVLYAGGGIETPWGQLEYLMGKTIYLELDVPNCAAVFIIIMGFTLAAAFFPAYRACSVRPVQALRSV